MNDSQAADIVPIRPGILDAPFDRIESRSQEQPCRKHVWSVSISEVGDERLRLLSPVTVMLEDFDSEVVASWPEIEAWGAATTEADAINALKDEVSRLYFELREADDEELGKLPRRWKRALLSVLSETKDMGIR